MKAVVFDRPGDPFDVLRVADIDAPAADGVLVRVAARPIQPADWAFIRGQYRLRPALPQTARLEGAGVVVQTGARVAFRWPGAWAEFAAPPAGRLIAVPADIPDEMACQVSLNPVTAWALLREAAAGPGDWVVLTAAASTVSNLVGAIARRRGIRVIGLVRGDAGAASARCTADHVLSSDAPSVAAAVAGDRRSAWRQGAAR